MWPSSPSRRPLASLYGTRPSGSQPHAAYLECGPGQGRAHEANGPTREATSRSPDQEFQRRGKVMATSVELVEALEQPRTCPPRPTDALPPQGLADLAVGARAKVRLPVDPHRIAAQRGQSQGKKPPPFLSASSSRACVLCSPRAECPGCPGARSDPFAFLSPKRRPKRAPPGLRRGTRTGALLGLDNAAPARPFARLAAL